MKFQKETESWIVMEFESWQSKMMCKTVRISTERNITAKEWWDKNAKKEEKKKETTELL